MNEPKLQLAASVLVNGIKKITGNGHSGAEQSSDKNKRISEAAYSIVGNSNEPVIKSCSSIFNILNGNSGHCGYRAAMLSENRINYPVADPVADVSELRKKQRQF